MTTFQVSVTDRCDADCPFCISKMTYRVNHNNFNWDKLEDAISYAEKKEIQIAKITGKWGEPLLVPERITGLLPHLQDFPEVELQTNAKRFFCDRSRWSAWRQLGLSLVSISCVHWDSFKSKTIYDQIIDLKIVTDVLKGFGYKTRLNCLLIRGMIDSPYHVDKFIGKFPNVDQISFMPVGTSRKSTTEIGVKTYNYAREHSLSSEEVQEIVSYLKSTYGEASKTSYSTTFRDGIYIADCLALPPTKDEYRHLIYFPDGTLRYSWEDPDSIIDIN